MVDVNLSEYRLFDVEVDYISIDLIKSYEVPKCKNETVNASVYECVLISGDTLFVFDFCHVIPVCQE